MRIPTKKELGRRLAERPLLRLLLYSASFRLAVFGCLLLLAALPLSMARIVPVPTAGVAPRIRISMLECLQARSLKRTALRAETDGRVEEARFAWQAALARNPADLELLRGSLRCVLAGRTPPADLGRVFAQTAWLLRLSATNTADVELAGRVAERLELHEWALALLGSAPSRPDERLERLYLESLFNAGHRQRFQERWRLRRNNGIPDPELGLYRAAATVGWGMAQDFDDAERALAGAMRDPAHGILAARLQLRVGSVLEDLARCEQAIQSLESRQADRLDDQILYWQVLDALGRRGDAARLAAQCSRAPETAFETARAARALAGLGLRAEAGALLDRYATWFLPAEPIWIVRAHLLLEDQEWEAARAVAVQIRLQPAVHASLRGFSYFVEGRADLADHRPAPAAEEFRACAAAEFPDATLGFSVARELDRCGEAIDARQLLVRLEPRLAQDPAYWRLLLGVATGLKDAELVCAAAAAAYRLRPAEGMAANNYAAALLLCGRQPEKALSLTLHVLAQNPDSATAKINHSLALLQNHRTAEAKALLDTVDPRRLTGPAATMLALARFQTCLALGDDDAARRDSEGIDLRYLFPSQVEQVEQSRRRLSSVRRPSL